MADFTKEHQQKLIRDKLNVDKVKLWLPPYTLENGEKGEQPKDLIERYAAELNLQVSVVAETFETLRLHAIQKLAERNQFQTEGIATLKVKLPVNQGAQRQLASFKIKLEESGRTLKEMVANMCETAADRLKLISSGKIIRDDLCLKEQGLKNGSQIMTVVLTVSEVEANLREKEAEKLSQTREAAELLSNRAAKDDTEFDIQIADQSGRPLNLPKEEKKALTLAMTLHEKGRSQLKIKNYSAALLLLLESDKEFCKCSASILDAVDNYAVLCLDIVWSYLCLKNLDQLPDAARRLKVSEECLKRSYGLNNERLTAIKGESSTQQALFMRLHLLQGIITFHQHDYEAATMILKQAEEELKRLTVDPDKITEVMSMGFSESECRLGLRACNGEIQQTVDYIMKKRQERKEIKEKVKADRENRKRSRKLGRTADGEWVNVTNYEMLLNMGFRPGASAEALRQANNDVTQALEVLQTHPELLNLPDPTTPEVPITDTMIIQLTLLGFEPEMCRRALVRSHGDVGEAAEILLQSGGVVAPLGDSSSSSSDSSSGSSSDSSGSSRTSTSSDITEKEREIITDLVSDIKHDEDEYLDLNLEEENQILSEYFAMLDSLRK